MAKLCVTGGLSVLILLTFGVCTSLNIEDQEIFHYDTYSHLSYTPVDIITLSSKHNVVKRQIESILSTSTSTLPEASTSPSPNAVKKDRDSVKSSNSPANSEQSSEENRSNSGQVNITDTPSSKVDNQSPPYRGGNVGVNGTGTRIIPPPSKTNSTVPKVVVSEPINPVSDENGNYIAEVTTGDYDGYANELQNSTILHHNITEITSDYHDYYNSTVLVDSIIGQAYWNGLYSAKNIVHSELLSQSHRRAVTVQLSFDFPFYGHLVRNVTVATGGFLYTGDYVHSWLAATQYIAPLMANFDTSLSNDSFIKYYDNGTSFTVVWEEVPLQERSKEGGFTFSATLHSTGDIVFVYRNVPMMIETIQDDKHPVKVGLSDAYIIDRTIFFARRKTIYEYHRVNFNKEDIKNWTIIYLRALPTCLSFDDCESCLTNNTGFDCSWCPATDRCSTGLDRNRQDWLQKGCNSTQITAFTKCPALGTKGNNAPSRNNSPDSKAADTHPYTDTNYPDTMANRAEQTSDEVTQLGHASSVAAALIPVCLVIILAGWLFYAYRNPHTKSGQMLIRYRPSQWTWRRGEARYTAATIHM